MIQFNLLPDVKLEYLRAQRQRRLVSLIAGIVTLVSLLLLGSLLATGFVQKKHLSDLSDTVTSESKKLQNKPQLNRILTVQNQLLSLTGLHSAKPATDRLFTYLTEVTPNTVDISNMNIDFTKNTVAITGDADSLSTVNQYIDTLKFTTYVIGTNAPKPAFSNVVLSAFTLTTPAPGSNAKGTTYTLTFSYDIPIFDITQQIGPTANATLTVPKKITTRSEVEKPNDLFNAPANTGAKQ